MTQPSTLTDLRGYIDLLRSENEIVAIDAEVDPRLEAAEIHRRVIAAGGPALLFRNMKGSAFPAVTNLFGSARRVELESADFDGDQSPDVPVAGRLRFHDELGLVCFTVLGNTAPGLGGGVLILKLGIHRALWVFGALQAVSTFFFSVLARVGNQIPALAAVVGFENLSGGMGTAAYVAYMASLCNRRFTATQYALLTSLMGVPRVVIGASTGYLAKHLGWETFFLACTLIAIPGMLLLFRVAPWKRAFPDAER